jgi:hypothetical protein
MSSADLAHLELLTQIDDVVGRLSAWTRRPTPWEPLQQSRRLMARLLERVDPVRLRIDAPLVVATFGGTGVGKSSLTNALIGDEVTEVGRQRPTTLQPTLIAHTDTAIDALGLPLDELRIVRSQAAMLRDWVLIDCPDPDTTERETTESNLARLHRILPGCDVLLYVSTQQKYRSARVGTELAQAAEGCRLIFVQTHADVDEDIRSDWRGQLEPAFQVAEMFFVDSRTALAEQRQGLRPTGEMGRLLDLLLRELSAAQRVRIRRGNLFGLLHGALDRLLADLDQHTPAVQALSVAVDSQRAQLTQRLSDRLRDELLVSRGAWERRLLAEVSQLWGLSPFALVLRAYHGQAGLLASWTLLRARSTAQMALWGAVHGARWVSSRQQDSTGEQQLERAASSQLSESDLREAQLVMEGHARTAKLDRAATTAALAQAPQAAAVAEDEFWSFARRRLDELMLNTAKRNSTWPVRLMYEVGFALLPAWLLYRIGKNFFFDSWWLDRPLLETNFYIPALLFLALWTGLVLMLFCRRLRRGTRRQVDQLATELAQSKLAGGLFPALDTHCREYHAEVGELRELATLVTALRGKVAHTGGLSTARAVERPPVAIR